MYNKLCIFHNISPTKDKRKVLWQDRASRGRLVPEPLAEGALVQSK